MEVRSMLLEEYDEKAEREYLKKESLEQGIQQGMEQGITLGNFEMLASLVEDGTLSMEQAATRMKDKKEEFILWYQEEKKKRHSD